MESRIELGPNETGNARFTIVAPKSEDPYAVVVQLSSVLGASGEIKFMIQPRKS